jgi:hypothetical protein
VVQLPPGSTHEVTHTVTTGLSVERSQMLANSLGLSIGGDTAGIQAKLNSQLQEDFGFKLNVSAQEERSTKLTLTNPSGDCYRLFALWHIDHRITVDALDMPVRRGLSEGFRPTWAPRGNVQFVTTNEPFITFMEIRRSRVRRHGRLRAMHDKVLRPSCTWRTFTPEGTQALVRWCPSPKGG